MDDTSTADTVVAVYGLGAGLSYPLLTTFTTAGAYLTLAPFTPESAAVLASSRRP